MSPGKFGVCSVCARRSAVTTQGVVRSHLVPKDLLGRNQARVGCEGSGLPPAEAVEEKPTESNWNADWGFETKLLAFAYNEMHEQLCRRGKFCSEHQPALALLDAARRQRDSLRSTISAAYSGIPEEETRLGDV